MDDDLQVCAGCGKKYVTSSGCKRCSKDTAWGWVIIVLIVVCVVLGVKKCSRWISGEQRSEATGEITKEGAEPSSQADDSRYRDGFYFIERKVNNAPASPMQSVVSGACADLAESAERGAISWMQAKERCINGASAVPGI